MPRLKRRGPVARAEWLTPTWTQYLLHGTGPLWLVRFGRHHNLVADPELRAAWECRRDELLATMPAGQRPHAWWLLDNETGDVRRCVNEHVTEGHLPRYLSYSPVGCEPVSWADSVPIPQWETQHEFLSRHGLLSEPERAALTTDGANQSEEES